MSLILEISSASNKNPVCGVMLIQLTSLPLFFTLLSVSIIISSAIEDNIRVDQTLRDGSTIVSAGGVFELGFVNIGNSTNRYVGVWYHKIAKGTIVWIANRETPLTTTSGLLKFDGRGNLVILNGTQNAIWSSKSLRSVKNPVVQLLDSGNVVIREVNDTEPGNFLWQSFDNPGDTFLPGSKFGWNFATGLETYYTSWKSENDPSRGEFTTHLDPNGFPQLIIKRGSAIYFRIGPWDGVRFSGLPQMKSNPFKFSVVSTDKELYYYYELENNSVVAEMQLNVLGYIQRYVYYENSQSWQLYYNGQMDNCDRYALCGAYSSCDIDNFPACECLKGFQPKNPQEWNIPNWSSGCVRKTNLSCGDRDGFVKHLNVKLPDTRLSWFSTSTSLGECKKMCLNNCSCTAYANTDVRGRGSGCLLWFNELIDMRVQRENGQALYIRMAASDLEKGGRSKMMRMILIPVLLVLAMLLGLCLYFVRRIKKRREAKIRFSCESDGEIKTGNDLELPIFSFTTIAKATENFSLSSKLGEGGFGSVYKGLLDDGKEIAVKRLSKDSRQGLLEFKNEVSCIAKLQHRNLVKLLGCTIKEGERMLIYEYLPNKSLDTFIFDKTQSRRLDWQMRYNIINGITKGLLYLHQDSRLRIIHRDLKASNILLDGEMNPKISDFGMARIFGGSETGANTTRVVGTYGYMPPEYAIDGIFSVKSDVYSFGVLLLEIVCGKINRSFTHPDHYHNLVGHVWLVYLNGRVLELIDVAIADLIDEQQFEVIRVIQIGLLCVQQYPAERPNMTSVFLMLSGDIPLPQPKQPGFFTQRRLHGEDSATSSAELNSPNYLSESIMLPR